jgi:transcriptional regulator with XRE-family HTH domain
MPQAKRDNGPWGEALRYWLNERKLRQADLVKGTKIQAKTISRIVRGFHTQTRVLEDVARFLAVPVERVLVSPLRRGPNDERRQFARGIVQDVLREIDGGVVDDLALDLARRIQALPLHLRQSVVEVVGQYEQATKTHRRKVRKLKKR